MMLSVCVPMGGVRWESPAAGSMCVYEREGRMKEETPRAPRRMLNFRREFSLILLPFYKLVKPIY